MHILDGKTTADRCYQYLSVQAAANNITPHLVVMTDGLDPASQVYIKQKQKAAEKCDFKFSIEVLNSEADFETKIAKLAADTDVHGIIVQQPCAYASFEKAKRFIPIHKDVDGFATESFFAPCTPKGILTLLYNNNIDVEGKHCVVLGRSEIVGRPLAKLLMNKNATVTVCHSKTPIELRDQLLREADIIFSCTGQPRLITPEKVKSNAIIVDVGITREPDGKLCGDAGRIEDWAHTDVTITPVPGGVGPMTVASLMQNVYIAAQGGI